MSSFELIARKSERKFIGLANYRYEFLEDPVFLIALKNTILWVVMVLAVTLAISLTLALVLNRRFRGRNLVRILSWMPWATPIVAVAVLWSLLYQPHYGLINSLLKTIGLQGPRWLGDPNLAFFAVMVVQIWRWVPFYTITILAGLQAIPTELYEAAAVDGAGAWQRFLNVTLPLVADTISLTLIIGAIWAVKAFSLIYSMTEGGPANSSHILGTLAYNLAFRYGHLGRGSAVGVVMAAILLVVGSLWIRRELKRWGQ
jgi:multiple sugar transport system permease protein